MTVCITQIDDPLVSVPVPARAAAPLLAPHRLGHAAAAARLAAGRRDLALPPQVGRQLLARPRPRARGRRVVVVADHEPAARAPHRAPRRRRVRLQRRGGELRERDAVRGVATLGAGALEAGAGPGHQLLQEGDGAVALLLRAEGAAVEAGGGEGEQPADLEAVAGELIVVHVHVVRAGGHLGRGM